jgi:hypothetical protein
VFKGEKNTVFWAGLIILGISLFGFCNSIWQVIYDYFFYPIVTSSSVSFTNTFRISMISSIVPSLIGGVIFMVIGLYMMKSGIRKNQPVEMAETSLEKKTSP